MWALRVLGALVGAGAMFGTLYLFMRWLGGGRCYVCGRSVLPWHAYCRHHDAT